MPRNKSWWGKTSQLVKTAGLVLKQPDRESLIIRSYPVSPLVDEDSIDIHLQVSNKGLPDSDREALRKKA